MLFTKWIVCALLSVTTLSYAGAAERVSGDDEAANQIGGMHSCASKYGIVTGLFGSENWLICLHYGEDVWATPGTVRSSQLTIPQGTRGAGQSMLACSSETEFVGGVHLQNNQLRCVGPDAATVRLLRGQNRPIARQGLRFFEMPMDVTGTRGVMACPKGMALVGLHMGHRVIACAYPPVCDISENCRLAGGTCRAVAEGWDVRICR